MCVCLSRARSAFFPFQSHCLLFCWIWLWLWLSCRYDLGFFFRCCFVLFYSFLHLFRFTFTFSNVNVHRRRVVSVNERNIEWVELSVRVNSLSGCFDNRKKMYLKWEHFSAPKICTIQYVHRVARTVIQNSYTYTCTLSRYIYIHQIVETQKLRYSSVFGCLCLLHPRLNFSTERESMCVFFFRSCHIIDASDVFRVCTEGCCFFRWFSRPFKSQHTHTYTRVPKATATG